ncbi:MAG: two pore domain potassium channel family protein [Actinobacteria bacterium]|nr:two pore domain potassium channel family protein [Actinomycetota bacterium]
MGSSKNLDQAGSDVGGADSEADSANEILLASKREFATIAALGLIMIAGFVFVPPKSSPIDWVDGILFFAGLLALSASAFLMIVREFTGRARRDSRIRILSVLVLIIAMLMFFAVSFYRLSGIDGEIVGLQTHLDAIYFTVSTSMTVGFGDVVAGGQIGRFIVLVQMIFNIVVLAAASKLATALFVERRKVKAVST